MTVEAPSAKRLVPALGWGLIPVGRFAVGLIGRIDLRVPFLVGAAGMVLTGAVFRRSMLVLSKYD